MRRSALLRIGLIIMVALGLFAWTGCGKEPEQAKPNAPANPAAASQDPAAKPYPLKICVVSGEELGKMGEPKRIVYEGQEIKFCCPSCEKDFRKEPAKFLKKIEEARKGS